MSDKEIQSEVARLQEILANATEEEADEMFLKDMARFSKVFSEEDLKCFGDAVRKEYEKPSN